MLLHISTLPYKIHPSSQPHQLKTGNHTFSLPGWKHDHPEMTDLRITHTILRYLRATWNVPEQIYCNVHLQILALQKAGQTKRLRDMQLCHASCFFAACTDLRDYFCFNAQESLVKLFLLAGCFFWSSLVFTSFSVQLKRLKIENTIWETSSTQHTQPSSISPLGSKNMIKSTATNQPHFPSCAWVGITPFRYVCLAKHSCISGCGSIWTLRSTCLWYKYPPTGYLTRNMKKNCGFKIFMQLLYITLTALHPSRKGAEHY